VALMCPGKQSFGVPSLVPKPHQNGGCLNVYFSHQRQLRLLLGIIALVNADGVDLKLSFCVATESAEGILKVDSNLDPLTVYHDTLWNCWVTPDIGECLIFGRISQGDNLQHAADNCVIVVFCIARKQRQDANFLGFWVERRVLEWR